MINELMISELINCSTSIPLNVTYKKKLLSHITAWIYFKIIMLSEAESIMLPFM